VSFSRNACSYRPSPNCAAKSQRLWALPPSPFSERQGLKPAAKGRGGRAETSRTDSLKTSFAVLRPSIGIATTTGLTATVSANCTTTGEHRLTGVFDPTCSPRRTAGSAEVQGCTMQQVRNAKCISPDSITTKRIKMKDKARLNDAARDGSARRPRRTCERERQKKALPKERPRARLVGH
jgi:hypothetical protein